MSVIYGIVNTRGQEVEALATLRKSLDVVCFDREAAWQDSGAYLGVLLRQLVQNEAEQAPLLDDDLIICADARLDNREELAEKLGIALDQLPDLPDSSLILQAYQKWGEDSPNHLLGDFAYAVYDKNRKSIFCARDHIGIRPFYYFWINGTFCFCTLREPLMAACPVPPTPNDTFIIASFIRAHAKTSHTVANEIKRLPAAHTLTLDATGLTTRRYWQPDSSTTLHLSSDEEYARAMREVFTQAVACRTRTDRRVGTHLSSGLDSGSITVLAARELRKQGKKPLAFSWSPAPENTAQKIGDERDLILDVCRQENIECRFSNLEPQETLQILRDSVDIWGENQLYQESKQLPAYKEADCRIMLSGWGGDELTSFTGHRTYLADVLSNRGLFRLMREIFQMRKNRCCSLGSAAKEVLYPFIPDFLYYRFFNLPVRYDCESLINPALSGVVRAERIKRSRWHQRDVKTVQRQYVTEGFPLHRIESWAELGERYGINYLYPVFDKRVIEFVLSLPTEQLCKNGWRRALFRHAMQDILPASVQWNRSKAENSMGEYSKAFIPLLKSVVADYLREVEGTPSFRRYFEAGAARKMLASRKVFHLIKVYSYAKFLERSFSLGKRFSKR